MYWFFQLCEHLFEYISTQFPPPSTILYGRGGFGYRVFLLLVFNNISRRISSLSLLNKDIFCVLMYWYKVKLKVKYSAVR